MKCPRCQAGNRDGARFCRECGATFGAVCSGCGAKVEAELLDPVLERTMEAVHCYEGTVNQVMGDGSMALFGAPLAGGSQHNAPLYAIRQAGSACPE